MDAEKVESDIDGVACFDGIPSVPPESDELFVRHNDVELAARVCDVYWAKKYDWYDLHSKRSNSTFYAALRLEGLNIQTVKADIRLLNKASVALGLTLRQVRGAYGLAKGVFNRSGRFISADNHSKAIIVDEEAIPSDGRLFDESNWLQVVESALKAKLGLPPQVQLDEEFRWIRANAYGWPDFAKAPSAGAVNDWLILNDPTPNRALIDFVKLAWSKRMAPGDAKSNKKAVFEEDVREVVSEDAVSAGKRDKELSDRLFGADGE
jgi:hypothetical protein